MDLRPVLRFKKGNGENFEDWDTVQIDDLMEIKDKKQVPTKDAPLMAFIANIGVAPKGEKYDRSHLVKSKDKKYKRTDINDFIYSSNNLDVGSIGLNRYGSAVISVVYEIFKIKDGNNPSFISELVQRPKTIKDIIRFRQGCLYGQYKIYPEDFLSVSVNVPCLEEQNKIADFIDAFDEKIKFQAERLLSYEQRRAGILQRIFSRKLCFNNDSYSEWDAVMLSDILVERKEKSNGTEDVYSVSVTKGLVNQIEHLGRSFAAENTSKYKVVHPGDVVYTKSPTGEFKWGIVKQSNTKENVIISPLYGVFIPENRYIGTILDAYFSSKVRAHNYLITQIRKGAKNTINVSNDEFLNKAIMLPTDINEQIKISNLIEALNEQVEIEREKLETLKEYKKAFMQRIFC